MISLDKEKLVKMLSVLKKLTNVLKVLSLKKPWQQYKTYNYHFLSNGLRLKAQNAQITRTNNCFAAVCDKNYRPTIRAKHCYSLTSSNFFPRKLMKFVLQEALNSSKNNH